MASVTADLEATGRAEISDALRHLVADVFTVFLKTKGFHWHIGGQARAFLDGLRVSAADRERIAHGNAERLLKM